MLALGGRRFFRGGWIMRVLSVSGVVIFVGMLISLVNTAQAFTCDDVRSLSRSEQEYWSKRLNLTREQRHQIWQACYGKSRSGRAGIRISKSGDKLDD
jgi:hypothetical protein